MIFEIDLAGQRVKCLGGDAYLERLAGLTGRPADVTIARSSDGDLAAMAFVLRALFVDPELSAQQVDALIVAGAAGDIVSKVTAAIDQVIKLAKTSVPRTH